MIGQLPTSLDVGGVSIPIRTDFRVILLIFQAFNDADLSNSDKWKVLFELLYEVPPDDVDEAMNKALWFLSCGEETENRIKEKPLYDWEQDEQMIMAAVNKVAGREIRNDAYLHFWTFMGYFSEIGSEGSFANVVSIRYKKNHGIELDKSERDFYRKNKDRVELRRRYTKEEQEQIDYLSGLIG